MDFDSPAAAQKAVASLKASGVQAQMAKVSLPPTCHSLAYFSCCYQGVFLWRYPPPGGPKLGLLVVMTKMEAMLFAVAVIRVSTAV